MTLRHRNEDCMFKNFQRIARFMIIPYRSSKIHTLFVHSAQLAFPVSNEKFHIKDVQHSTIRDRFHSCSNFAAKARHFSFGV